MTAEKLLVATFGKFILTIAGIDSATPPVARQLLPQYGRSASALLSALIYQEEEWLLASGNQHDWTSKVIHHRQRCESQQLTLRDGLLCSLSQLQDGRIVVMWFKELQLIPFDIGSDQVAVW